DGTKIAAQCTRAVPGKLVTDVCVIPAAGGKIRALTSRDPADDLYPIWSPDSSELVYSSARASTHGRYAIYAIPADGRKERKGTGGPGGAGAGEPAYSPDGKEIAFIGHVSSKNGTWRLYVIPSAGGKEQAVETPSGRVDSPAWQPNGKEFAFMRLPTVKGHGD